MIVKYSPSFLKISKGVDVRIRQNFKQKIAIFYKNPENPQLNNHSLKTTWKGYRSIDITKDWRAIYQEVHFEEETVAYFIVLGTHKDLYQS